MITHSGKETRQQTKWQGVGVWSKFEKGVKQYRGGLHKIRVLSYETSMNNDIVLMLLHMVFMFQINMIIRFLLHLIFIYQLHTKFMFQII